MLHFADLFRQTDIDGALAASVFHSGKIPIPDLKAYLKSAINRSASLVMPDMNLDQIDWDKGDGLVPAIIQNSVIAVRC